MKKKALLTVAFAALLGFSIALSAQDSQAAVSATPASANLLVAMKLKQNSVLSFGSSLLTNKDGGTVILPSSNVDRDYTGGVSSSEATPSPSNASYSVTGTANETYAVVLETKITVTHTSVDSGVNSMDITDITARFNGKDTDDTVSTLASDGTDSFSLGGTLTVQANQVSGRYTGLFAVNVDYN
jgi:hypothetical protein